VELAGEPYPRREVTVLKGLAVLTDHVPYRSKPSARVGRAHPFDDCALNDATHLEHLVYTLQRGTGYERTTIRFEIDQAVFGKKRERLSDCTSFGVKDSTQLCFV
jgi:hypothetical protein